MPESENERVKQVYQVRQDKGWAKWYSLFQKGALQQIQEREREFDRAKLANRLESVLLESVTYG